MGPLSLLPVSDVHRCLLVETRQKQVVWCLVVQLEGFTLWPICSLAPHSTSHRPNGPKSRGCWVQSSQRINTVSCRGRGWWSLIGLGWGARLGPNCFFYRDFWPISCFRLCVASRFSEVAGPPILSLPRVTDITAHFLAGHCLQALRLLCFLCWATSFLLAFRLPKLRSDLLATVSFLFVLVGLCHV